MLKYPQVPTKRVKKGMRLKREFAPPAALPGVQLPLGTRRRKLEREKQMTWPG